MRYLILSIIILSLTACGKVSDPTFQPIIDQFIKDAATQGNNVQVFTPINFGDVKSQNGASFDTVAICMNDVVSNEIIVDKDHWNDGYTTDFDKKMIIYHELGHCVFNLSHKDTTKFIVSPVPTSPDNEVPISIMNSHGVHYSDYSSGGEAYLNSLYKDLFAVKVPLL